MIKITRLAILIPSFLVLAHTLMLSQAPEDIDCSFLKDCKLLLKEEGIESVVTISGDKHVELVDEGIGCVKSDLEWLNDCEYKASITYFKWPGFMFDVGEVMHAKVIKIIGDSIYILSLIHI